MVVKDYFSGSYVQAREKFVEAAHAGGFEIKQMMHPSALGPDNENLSIDLAIHAPAGARSLLIVTSGTHGVEGFCGSGCQVGLLQDAAFLAEARRRGVALLMIHGVNPYGFAHLRRVNEDNVDLNRNSTDFSTALDTNPGYMELDPLLMPTSWPPDAANQAALGAYIRTHGEHALRDTVSKGQYAVPDGMFYGGAQASWSTQTVHSILRAHASGYCRFAWIDLHTGLGPYGHGEKIFMSTDRAELERARRWWGNDVKPIHEAGSVSADVRGPIITVSYDEFPDVQKTTLGLEFGTYDALSVLHALRADHWLHRHPECGATEAAQIRQNLKDAFYCDNDEWKGLVFGQTRVLAWQAIAGLSEGDSESSSLDC
ncbi:MAG TPA: M14 family metallopeptidase [Paraburkholderia sp.]|uniref:M14 family metallopeptidase n=1 Tax=Paraburkholderia sp. TaxID=1926495 RepID=UPI002C250177|nr:M14 family metallopeptidase [Paraburkholderia sp.]HTR10555.1 M14 family metallopeptidase [Paraburkholderia sp.]